jgi:HAD superfamily hydrolase (TIGR01509 family)
MMGMSSPEWSQYLVDELGVELSPQEITDRVLERVLAGYRDDLPLLPGAAEAVEGLAARWPLGLASSSNREAIELVLELSGLDRSFAVTLSSEEVGNGKPEPDVYLEVARRLEVDPDACVAVEDSENGIRSANAAGMGVVAVPNDEFPPAEDAIALADRVLESLDQLTPKLIEDLDD